MYDEMDKVEQRLAQVLNELGINAEELPDLVEMANQMKKPSGDSDIKFVNDVREAQKCQQNLKELEVTHIN